MPKSKHRKKPVHREQRTSIQTTKSSQIMPKGIYTEYLDKNLHFDQLTQERKKQLQKISQLRGNRGVLVFASDFKKSQAPISIDYSDLMPVNDQLSVLKGNKLDLILETPGGLGEVAEDIVKLMRSQFDEVGVIIPGWCKVPGL